MVRSSPDEPVCGRPELELSTRGDFRYQESQRKKIETLRGCKATITGRLSFDSPITHRDAIYLDADEIAPDKTCKPMPEFPDYSKLKPKRTVNRCEVQLTVSLVGEGSTRAVARDHGQVITPWQAYLTYQMDDDGENRNISATCGYGFVVGNVRVANDPEPGAALAGDAVMGVEDRSMTHTCTRVVSPDDH